MCAPPPPPKKKKKKEPVLYTYGDYSTALTPEHSSPHCVAELGVSGFNGQVSGCENLNRRRRPRSLLTVAPTQSAFGKTGQGNSIQVSPWCSTSYRGVALVSVPRTTIITNVRL